MDVSRALTARRLALELNRLSTIAAALADETVYELTRDRSHAEVAAALGVGLPSVRKAIRQHNARKTEGTDSDILIPAKAAPQT